MNIPQASSTQEGIYIVYDDQHQILKGIWTKASADLSDEEYKGCVRKWLRAVIDRQATRVIVDTREMYYTIVPEIQSWFDQEIFSQLRKYKPLRIAFILGEDVFTRISVEQTIEEDSHAAFFANYFSNEETALAWLLSA